MKHNVLYIDDEEVNLRVFKSAFRRDYNIYTALSGEEGLQIVEEEDLQLIVTDERMPKMNGCEFLKRVYQKIPSIPPNRIILSGFSKTQDIEEAKEKYCLYMFISKPWEADEFRNTMNDAIINAFESNS